MSTYTLVLPVSSSHGHVFMLQRQRDSSLGAVMAEGTKLQPDELMLKLCVSDQMAEMWSVARAGDRFRWLFWALAAWFYFCLQTCLCHSQAFSVVLRWEKYLIMISRVGAQLLLKATLRVKGMQELSLTVGKTPKLGPSSLHHWHHKATPPAPPAAPHKAATEERCTWGSLQMFDSIMCLSCVGIVCVYYEQTATLIIGLLALIS